MHDEYAAVPWPWVAIVVVALVGALGTVWKDNLSLRKEIKAAGKENTSLLREGFDADKEQTKVAAEAGAAFTALKETVRLVEQEVRAHKGATHSMRESVDRLVAVLETFMSKSKETG